MTLPLSQKYSVKQEGRVCQWFSLSDAEHCQKTNEAEFISHCLCYARTLIFQGRECAVLQFSADTSQGERRRKKNVLLALTFTN